MTLEELKWFADTAESIARKYKETGESKYPMEDYVIQLSSHIQNYQRGVEQSGSSRGS